MITITSNMLALSWPAVVLLLAAGLLAELVREIAVHRAQRRIEAVRTIRHDDLTEQLGKIVDLLSDSFATQEEVSKILTEIRDDAQLEMEKRR